MSIKTQTIIDWTVGQNVWVIEVIPRIEPNTGLPENYDPSLIKWRIVQHNEWNVEEGSYIKSFSVEQGEPICFWIEALKGDSNTEEDMFRSLKEAQVEIKKRNNEH